MNLVENGKNEYFRTKRRNRDSLGLPKEEQPPDGDKGNIPDEVILYTILRITRKACDLKGSLLGTLELQKKQRESLDLSSRKIGSDYWED